MRELEIDFPEAVTHDAADHDRPIGCTCSMERAAPPLAERARMLQPWLPDANGTVLEMSAGRGDLHFVHEGYRGIEESQAAVDEGRRIHPGIRLDRGDAGQLPVRFASVDLLFTFAPLEGDAHVERVLDEVDRVLKPGGIALLPAPWSRDPRQSLPRRVLRELRGGRVPEYLAVVHGRSRIDSHAALLWFSQRGYHCLSHPGAFDRLGASGEPIVVRKRRVP